MTAQPPPASFSRPLIAVPPPPELQALPAVFELPQRPGDWLREPIWANRALFGQVALAAALINVFALATSLFSMTVYNKIVPNNAVDSMMALLIGISLVLAFDFLLRTLRGYFVDVAGQNIDRELGEAIFDRLIGMKLSDRSGSNGAFAGVLREFETLREFFASATVVALVDVPFILLFLVVIWAVAAPLAWVPLLTKKPTNEPRMPPADADSSTFWDCTTGADAVNSDGALGGTISMTPAPTMAMPDVINGATRSIPPRGCA